MIADKQELVGQRAYDLWLEEGRPAGRAEANWYQAERELSDRAAEAPAVDRGPAADTAPGESARETAAQPLPETPRTGARRRTKA